MLAAAFSCGLLQAADTYTASLQAGDTARRAKKPDVALTEYEAAEGQAKTDTERGLAKGKAAMVYAFDLNEYAKGKELAEEVLGGSATGPVALVTAIQALAQCQMIGDEDYDGAAETLNFGFGLGGVDWAQPILSNMLGDCYRFGKRFDEALAAYRRVEEMPEANADIKAIALLNTGITYQYGLNDAENAREAYAAAVVLKPSLKGEVEDHLGKLP